MSAGKINQPGSIAGQPVPPAGSGTVAGGQSAVGTGLPVGRPVAAPLPQPAAAQPVAAKGARAVPVAARPVPVPAKKTGELPVAKQETVDDDATIVDRTWRDIVRNAPAWLISTVVHMALLLILALIVVVRHQDKRVEIESVYAERLGEQLTDDSVLVSGDPRELTKADKQIITPQNLPPVDDPFAAPPSLAESPLAGFSASSDISSPAIGFALTGREVGSKTVLLAAYGGNKTTESAVLLGLQWLAKQQRTDGTWSVKGPYSSGRDDENIEAATAMALLAFQGAGNTHRKGEFSKNVDRAWKALLKRQDKEGNFFHGVKPHDRLYTQAQCTIALCELYGMTQDSQLREPAERAVKYAVSIQDKQGGWRYFPGEDSDTSVTGWFVMALQSARMARIDVPQQTLDNISSYLDKAQIDYGREYMYQPDTFTTPAVTAEGLLCRQYLGWKQNDQRLIDGVKALTKNPVNYNGNDRDVYYWYYATQAAHHMENVNNEGIWQAWNKVMRQEVPTHQVKEGPEAGSWEPAGDKWGDQEGRLYVTCLSIYMLEVYYRHLPIYSGYKFAPSK
jgi:hypothetical protein